MSPSAWHNRYELGEDVVLSVVFRRPNELTVAKAESR